MVHWLGTALQQGTIKKFQNQGLQQYVTKYYGFVFWTVNGFFF